jgi:hypothetical protein
MPDSYIMASGGWSTMDTPRKVYIKTMEAENAKYAEQMNAVLLQVLLQGK